MLNKRLTQGNPNLILNKPILVMGLPGSGKTTLAKELAKELKAVHWNADEVREYINKDLGFSIMDRIEQAKRMGYLARTVVQAGHPVIADFICPLEDCRKAFGAAHIVFIDRISKSKYPDTDAIFERPLNPEVIIPYGMTVREQINHVLSKL